MTRFLVFGDSITAGAFDYEEGGWVSRLRKFLDMKVLVNRKFGFRVYNLGVSGDTTEDLLYRFEFETKNRIKDTEDNIMIFQIGINDSLLMFEKEKSLVPLDKFKDNIKKLIKLSQKFTDKVIFIGPTPVDESKATTREKKGEKFIYKNSNIQKFNDAVKMACKEEDVLFLDNYSSYYNNWMKSDYKELLEDDVHPNSEGHEKIFESVKDFLIKNKII